jgi:hypothetical protein
MSVNDITLRQPGAFGTIGTRRFLVAAGATTINPGEPVAKALGAAVVTALATNKPVVGTDFMAGIAMSTSTQTASAAGYVDVLPLVAGVQYLINPNSAAAFDTQAEYDALVGDRVLFDLTSGVYTILATDGATSGLVIESLNVLETPGKVAFSIRNGVNYLA